jgi:hypothetical protein
MESKRKKKLKHFLTEFRVKRITIPCLIEYTRESFFHKVMNVGLRVLHAPDELIYLRLPFFNLLWSIKFIYHRHKKAIF